MLSGLVFLETWSECDMLAVETVVKQDLQLRTVYRALIFGNKSGARAQCSVRWLGCAPPVGTAVALTAIVLPISCFLTLMPCPCSHLSIVMPLRMFAINLTLPVIIYTILFLWQISYEHFFVVHKWLLTCERFDWRFSSSAVLSSDAFLCYIYFVTLEFMILVIALFFTVIVPFCWLKRRVFNAWFVQARWSWLIECLAPKIRTESLPQSLISRSKLTRVWKLYYELCMRSRGASWTDSKRRCCN